MNPNPFSQKIKIYTFSALALTVAVTLLRTVGFLFFFDDDLGYFDITPLNTITTVLCILTVIWLLTAVIFIPKYSFPLKTKPAPNSYTRLAALFCGMIVVGSFFFFRQSMYYYIAQAKSYQLLSVFSLLAAVYFLLHFLGQKNETHSALASYAVILWAAMLMSVSYLNLYVAMNSPLKVTLHVALLSIMLFLMEEARLLTDHEFRILYYAASLIAILTCSISSLPIMAAHLAETYWDVDYLLYSILMLGFLIYIGTRCHACYRLLMTLPCMTPEEIEADKAKKKKAKEEAKQKEKEKKEQKKLKKQGETPADAPKTQNTETQEGDDNHVR